MQVYISATLKSFFGRNHKLGVDADTVKGVLDLLVKDYPDSEKILFDENGALRSFIKIYSGDEDVTSPDRWNEKLPESAELLLLPAIAGGAPEESIIPEERRKETELDDVEIERFGKHLLLRDIGVKGQKRIKAARVVVAGVGALGSSVIQYLAAAGVGNIKAVDFDEVKLENLQNQVIHTTRDINRPKVASAKDKVKNINKSIFFEAENLKLDAENILQVIEGYDLVIDCTDNYKARYLINDACELSGIPEVFGAIYQFEGQVAIFDHKGGPCYRCLYPAPPEPGLVPTCAEGGAISPLPGIIGSYQANEALKLILGIGEHLTGKILSADTLNLRTSVHKITKSQACPLCGKTPSITAVEDFDYEELCGLKISDEEEPVEGISPDELAKRIDSGDEMLIVDVREPHERTLLRFPGAVAIPIGQLARRQNEFNPDHDTIFVCREGQRSILAIRTMREAGYKGPMYNLKGGTDAMKDIIFSHESAWL